MFFSWSTSSLSHWLSYRPTQLFSCVALHGCVSRCRSNISDKNERGVGNQSGKAAVSWGKATCAGLHHLAYCWGLLGRAFKYEGYRSGIPGLPFHCNCFRYKLDLWMYWYVSFLLPTMTSAVKGIYLFVWCALTALLTMIASLRSFSADRLQFWRESASGVNRIAFFLAKDMADLFNVVLRPLIYLSMFYFFCNPRSSFLDNYVVTLVLVYCVTGLAYIFAILLEPAPAQLVSFLW